MAAVRRLGLATALGVVLAFVPAAVASRATVSVKRLSGASPFASGCGQPGQPSVGSEVEPDLAVDPLDPSRLLASWQQDRHTLYGGARGNRGARTSTAGRRFTPLTYPGLTKCAGGPRDRSSDPWVSFGVDGRAYAAHLTFDWVEPFASQDLAGPTQIVVQTSRSGGRRFTRPVTLVDDGIFDDRPALTADPWRPRRAYIMWTRRTGTFGETGLTQFSKTTNGGRTWTPRRTIYEPGPLHLTIPTLINVLRDGTLVSTAVVINAVYAVSNDPVTFDVVSMRSTDGGNTWSKPVRIGQTISREPEDPDGSGGLRALPIVATDVSPSGVVYSSWNRIDSDSKSELLLSRSTDGGRTWSAPKALAAPAGQAFLPSLAVGADGTLGVMWDDTRNDRKGDRQFTTDVWFAHSHTRGRTWSQKHVAGPFDAATAPPTSSTMVAGNFIGDYQALVPQPGGFAAIFAQAKPAAKVGASDAFFARMRTVSRRRLPKLRLSVRPRRTAAGGRKRFTFKVTRRVGRLRRPIPGALIRFAGHRLRTNRRGRAAITLRFHRAGVRRAVATKRDFRRGRAAVRVR
jgi:hypothetical protein